MARGDGGGEVAEIVDHRIVAGPESGLGRAAKPALIDGVGRNPLGLPIGGRAADEAGVVVHAVKGDDQRARMRRLPA